MGEFLPIYCGAHLYFIDHKGPSDYPDILKSILTGVECEEAPKTDYQGGSSSTKEEDIIDI